MIFLKRYNLLFLWLIIFFIIITVRLLDGFSSNTFRTVLGSKSNNNLPAGEVIAGFYLRQPINWALIDEDILLHEASNPICVNILLANYSDRDNDGKFALSLKVESDQHQVFVDAKTVIDNKYKRVCYNDILLGDIVYKPVDIILEGINSQSGKAITAWLTYDIVNGSVRLSDGTISDKSLIFSIQTISYEAKKSHHAIILTLICGLTGILILFATLSMPLNFCSKNNFIQKDNQ
jgi:hypothetical protein